MALERVRGRLRRTRFGNERREVAAKELELLMRNRRLEGGLGAKRHGGVGSGVLSKREAEKRAVEIENGMMVRRFAMRMGMAKKGHYPSLLYVGQAMLYGMGVTVDLEGARSWLGRAAACKEATDSCRAMLAEVEGQLAALARAEDQKRENWEEGEALMRECYNVRKHFYCPKCTPGFDEPHGQQEANRFLEKAVKMNHPPALMEMHRMALEGEGGVKRDLAIANLWARQAAHMDFFPAKKQVAMAVAFGIGEVKNLEVASEEFRALELIASNGAELQIALLGLAACLGHASAEYKDKAKDAEAADLYREVAELRRLHGQSVCAQCLNDIAPSEKTMYCGGCRIVSYCGRGCQQDAWVAGHRHFCSSLTRGSEDSALPPGLRRPIPQGSTNHISLERLDDLRPTSAVARKSFAVHGPMLVPVRPHTARPQIGRPTSTRPQTARLATDHVAAANGPPEEGHETSHVRSARGVASPPCTPRIPAPQVSAQDVHV